MNKYIMNNFAKERDSAIIEAVMNDNWDKVKQHSQKYGIPIPEEENVMKAGVYKAAQYCTNIPEEVKDTAMRKCLKIGFNPFFEPPERGNTQ